MERIEESLELNNIVASYKYAGDKKKNDRQKKNKARKKRKGGKAGKATTSINSFIGMGETTTTAAATKGKGKANKKKLPMDYQTNSTINATLEEDFKNELKKRKMNLDSSLLSIQSQAQAASQEQVMGLSEENIANMTFSPTELIPFCRFAGKPCYVDNKTHNVWRLLDIFNDIGSKARQAERPGMEQGLNVIVRSDPDEYVLTSDVMGARVLVHPRGDYPFPEIDGINLAQGFSYVIPFKKESYKYLAGNCYSLNREYKSIYPTTYRYSRELCHRACAAKLVYSNCGCVDPIYPAPEEALADGLNSSNAACNQTDLCFTTVSRTEAIQQCRCEPPCTFNRFDVSVTASTWPIVDTHLAKFCRRESGTCADELRESLMKINIYPMVAHYEEVEESLSMTTTVLYNKLASSVTIWLGCSLVATVELIAFTLHHSVCKMKYQDRKVSSYFVSLLKDN